MWIDLPQISPQARNNACSVCGSNVKEVPALGTGVFVEWEGEIQVCHRCITEAAARLGLISADRLAEVEGEFAALTDWSSEAYDELSRRDEVIETLSSALAKTVGERDALARDAAEAKAGV